jgi:hypothetical protein
VNERANRPSARIVLVDDEGCVPLFRIVDALDTKPPVWITPGAGVERGEDLLMEMACSSRVAARGRESCNAE